MTKDCKIFCIGGDLEEYFHYIPTNRVWQLDIKEKVLKWKQIAPMNEKRCEMGAAMLQDKYLVVAGGTDGSNTLASVEYFEESKWKLLSPMNQRRNGNTLVCSKGCLYTLGGKCRGEFLSSVERLRDLSGQWEYIQPMQTPRYAFAAVNCNGFIYAIGGTADNFFSFSLKSVERYDSVSNTWSYVKEMKFQRRYPSACVMNGKIYVVGGMGNGDAAVTKIECFEPSNNMWTEVGNTDKLFHHAVIAL